MRGGGTAKRAGVLGHLLLVVVLAFSVFTMHTLGHPDGRSGGHENAPSSHAAAAAAATGPMAMAAHGSGEAYGHRAGRDAAMGAHDAGRTAGQAAGLSAEQAGAGAREGAAHPAGPATPADPSKANGPAGHGMDPLSVCVAVLGSLLIAGLVRVLLARRRAWRTTVPAAAAAASPAPRAPPPRAPRLAELSVLRI
ncbi:hypothetical protein [Streptomyces sp. NPDC048639]|uniref:hypothetical protein n=1 Tax=Streptomyces sp. NPDC048639 TaxID=3365581 RepID=UPI0037156DDD